VEEQGDESPPALKTCGLTAQGSPFRVTVSLQGTGARQYDLSNRQTPRHSPRAAGCIRLQARYHRLTNSCPSADLRSPPIEVLLPCNIHKAALFSPDQMGLPHTCYWPRASWRVTRTQLTGSTGQASPGLTSKQKKSESLSGSIATRLPPSWRSLSHHKVSQVLVKQLPDCSFSAGLLWSSSGDAFRTTRPSLLQGQRVLQQHRLTHQHVSQSHELQRSSFPWPGFPPDAALNPATLSGAFSPCSHHI